MSLLLDAGAFVAMERGDRFTAARVSSELLARRTPITHGGVIGQVWRSGAGRQARIAKLVPALEIAPLDAALGRRAGVLLGRARRADVVDAALVLLAADGDSILTSDPHDLEPLAFAAEFTSTSSPCRLGSMREVLAWVVAAAACGGSGPGVEAPSPAEEAGARLLDATARRDAAAIAAMLDPELYVGGLWFADMGCRAHFPRVGMIAEAGYEQLAACLAALPLRRSARTSPLPNVAVFTYAPGIEIEAVFTATASVPKLRWIGYVPRHDAAPTVTPELLEAHRRGEAGALDDEARAGIEREVAGGEGAETWFEVCVDATGGAPRVRPRETSSVAAQLAFARLVEQWAFEPVMLDGVLTPVCALVALAHPATAAPSVLPYPVPADHATAFVVPHRLIGPRTGKVSLVPPDEVRAWMAQRYIVEVVSTFLYCLDESGAVDRVLPLRPANVPRYTDTLIAGIKRWRFPPFLVDGKPARVCTHVNFVYRQQAPRPSGVPRMRNVQERSAR